MDSKKFSYALGVNLAANFGNQGFLSEVNVEDLAKGMSDFLSQSMDITLEESGAIVNEHLQALDQKKHQSNIEEGKTFLQENAKRDEVVELPSGLQYEILVEGNGAKPSSTSQVKTHYHGTLIDGTVFDSSVQRGTPATFGVNQVIKGWTEALQLMPAGSKWKLFVPSNLAYGDQGAGNVIKPHSTLVFEVELLEVL